MPFSAEDSERLDQVLDTLVPARDDVGLPGAGGLGVGAYVRERLDESADLFRPSLSWLAEQAAARGASSFGDLSLDARGELLNQAETEQPGFLPALLFHTYAGYYQDPRVVGALGVPPRPPHPEGYPLEAGDLSRLERVRARARLYREA